MLSSLLVLLLLSVVVVGGADAHAQPSSTIRQRTLQDRDTSSASVCSPTSFEYGGPCDVLTQDGKKCYFDYVYVGDCGATEEELECLPEMTCTCNGLRDGTWACPQDRRRDSMTAEMMPAPCPDTGITVSVEPGDTCTPLSPTSTATSSASSTSTSTSSGAATADDETLSASTNAVDNDNDIDSVEVTTPAVVDDNDSSTTITVKEGESDGAMSSLSSSSSSSQQQGLGVAKVAMVAAATTTAAGITALFL